MSSDLHFYDSFFYPNSSPEIVSSDGELFFQDPFFPFYDSSPSVFSELSNNQNNQYPVNSNTLDNLTPNLLSSSPPSHQLESLSLYSSTPLQQPVPNGENLGGLANGYDFSGLGNLGVKTEECQMGFESFESCYNNQQLFMPHSYSGVENVAKMIQRSYSSNSFEAKPDFLFKPLFDTLLESPNYQNHALSPPQGSFLSGQMRRVCSTGDLQNMRTSHSTQRSTISSPLASESSLVEDGNFNVGRYSAEERKDRIAKYRAKRNRRNFTKTIKYACRKTLADNRPRIRGRFARNDETGEIPKAACSTRHEDEDELWFDGLHGEEDDGGSRGRGEFVNSDGKTQFQYYS